MSAGSRIGREPNAREKQAIIDFLDDSGRGFEPTREDMAGAAWTLMQRAEYEVADRLAAAGYDEAAEAIRNRTLRGGS